MAASAKSLMKVCETLETRYGKREPLGTDDFIESLVYQILELSTTEKQAKDALARIDKEYVDWNDMRVASIREIQDILGADYPRCREKAEDLASLLADLYTAFRRMELGDLVRTPDGIDTLRALPDTTLIREDMVERALLEVCKVHTMPCDEDQFEQLKFMGGVPKKTEFEEARELCEELLTDEEMMRLSRGLREHTDMCQQYDSFDPEDINFGLDKKGKPLPKPKPRPVAPPPLLPPAEAGPEIPPDMEDDYEPTPTRPVKVLEPAVESKPTPPPAPKPEPEPVAEPVAAAPEPEEAPAPEPEAPKKAAKKKTTKKEAKAPAKKAAAKKAPAKKAAKKAPAKKTAAKKAVKTAPAKKAATKKAAKKKTAAKKATKAPSKKTAKKKTAAKKATKKAAKKKK